MDQKFINPFVASVKNVFSTMLDLDVEVGEAQSDTSPESRTDHVRGIIEMNGDVAGAAAVCLPKQTALEIVSLFCGEPTPDDHPDFDDAVGEIANMVCGGAKSRFGGEVEINCPVVTRGDGYAIDGGIVDRVVIPCRTERGEFVIEIVVAVAQNSTTANGSAEGRGR